MNPAPPARPAEVVVVGGGIVGAATAYYLARSGLKPTLLEAGGPISGGAASPACAGGVRHQGRTASEIPLALEAIGLWPGLEGELESDLHYRRDGMTVVTDDPDRTVLLAERAAAEQALGLDTRLVEGGELHRMIPGLNPGVVAGTYCPLDGHADPMRTVNALLEGAKRLGVRVIHNCPVVGLEVHSGRVAGLRTADRNISCDITVLAAGAWSADLAATAGLRLPLRTYALQMMVTARRAHELDQVLGWLGHGLSLKQVPDGGFVIGGGWPARFAGTGHRTDLVPGAMAKSARTAVSLYPGLARLPVIRAWAGKEAFTADESQILGPVSGLDGLILATGFSGHGFAIGPGVGRLLARYITLGEWPELLTPFLLSRFEDR